jgi:hypothetical protein
VRCGAALLALLYQRLEGRLVDAATSSKIHVSAKVQPRLSCGHQASWLQVTAVGNSSTAWPILLTLLLMAPGALC